MWECTKSVTKWGNASTKGSARASLFVHRWSCFVVRGSLVVLRCSGIVVRASLFGDRWSCIVGRASLFVLRCSLVVLLLSLRVSEGGLMENCYDHP
jgi:hypothetical protein